MHSGVEPERRIELRHPRLVHGSPISESEAFRCRLDSLMHLCDEIRSILGSRTDVDAMPDDWM